MGRYLGNLRFSDLFCTFLIFLSFCSVHGLETKGGGGVYSVVDDNSGEIFDTEGENRNGPVNNIKIRVRDPTYVYSYGGFTPRPGQMHGNYYQAGRRNQGPNVQINPKSTSGFVPHDINPTVERMIHHTDDFENTEDLKTAESTYYDEAVVQLRQTYFQSVRRGVAPVNVNPLGDKRIVRARPVGVSNDIYSQFKDPPPHDQVARMARFIVRNSNWTSMATISSRDPTTGFPFVNVASVSDGTKSKSTGVPYMYLTPLDISVIDFKKDPRVSLTMSLAQGEYCRAHSYDPEDPRCAHVILTGRMVEIDNSTREAGFARMAMFSKHPEMVEWPKDHGWFFAKLDISHILVLDYFGGAKSVKPQEYFNANNQSL